MRLAQWLMIVALLQLAGIAAAQEAPIDPAEAEAREHFDIGRRLYDLGQFREAAAAFERAYERSPRPQLLMNMYLSYRDAAEPVRAADALRRYLATDAVPATERPALERRLRALEASDGDTATTTTTTTTTGTSTPAPPHAPSRGPDVTGPAVLLAAGGALLVAGAITGGVTASEHGQLDGACPDRVCPDSEAGRLDTIRTLGVTTDVLLPVGGAAAAAGLIWLIVALSGGDDDVGAARAGCDGDGCFGAVGGTF